MGWDTALIALGSFVFSFTVTFVAASLMEKRYGRHRKSAAALYGSADQIPDPSPGGSAQIGPLAPNPNPYVTLYPGSIAGAAGWAQAHAQQQQSIMAYAGTVPPPMLGSGPPSALLAVQMQMAAAQYAHMQAQQAMQHHQTLVTVPAGARPPHTPTTLKSEGIHAGEIIAWRAWNIFGDDLASAVICTIWSPTDPMQGDAAGGYGVHAYKSPHGPFMDNYAGISLVTPWVVGEVALWGDVIEHERGYRAEYARVHSLVTWSRIVPDYSTRKIISEKYLGRTMTDDPLPPTPLS